jgi:glutamate synthase (NADPH/NADH) large chain
MATDILYNTMSTEHGACGNGATRTLIGKARRSIVEVGITNAANFEERAGYNEVTGESDGVGLTFYGVPTAFWQQRIGQFTHNQAPLSLTLKDNNYAIGQFFFPTDEDSITKAKALVVANAAKKGLRVAGWRNLDDYVNKEAVSGSAWDKKPAQWQAILLPIDGTEIEDLEQAALETSALIINDVKSLNDTKGTELDVTVVSLSAESITYKGMIETTKIGQFFNDLGDADFMALHVQVHARMATNTSPAWKKAQPCSFKFSHNGEVIRYTNAKEMEQEVAEASRPAVLPNMQLSDSMQFDADLFNVQQTGISFEEAFVRLLPPPQKSDLLEYFRLQRTPYNGPGFMVADHKGTFIARLDAVGLRPARWAVITFPDGTEELHVYSDDTIEVLDEDTDLAPEKRYTVKKKGQIEPGGILMVDKNGKVYHTQEVLERIEQQVRERGIDPAKALKKHLVTLDQLQVSMPRPTHTAKWAKKLHQRLYASFWDYEAVEDVLMPLARGEEKVGAMGDDTSVLPDENIPLHISVFFHQLFAQVTLPPIDSIKERESFDLTTTLGSNIGTKKGKEIRLDSPILAEDALHKIEHNNRGIKPYVIDTTFALPPKDQVLSTEELAQIMQKRIKKILKEAEEVALQGGVIILSDRNISAGSAAIPDMIAVAAVRKHLEAKRLIKNVSIVADSYQITGPHQAAALLAMGAKAVYARGAYEKIQASDDPTASCDKFQHAMEKSLLKIMGKMGITDVNNYINGNHIAAMGLDFEEGKEDQLTENPMLSNIFKGTFGTFKGANLGHVVNAAVDRHHQAYTAEDLTLLPHAGRFRPESGGIMHGYGPQVVVAFRKWMAKEEVKTTKVFINEYLEKKGKTGFIDKKDYKDYTAESGFLDETKKDANGFYPPEYLATLKVSKAFKDYCDEIAQYRKDYPIAISDHLEVHSDHEALNDDDEVQSTQDIRALISSGNMSQGALTVAPLEAPGNYKAHETITRGMNAIGAKSGCGEGSEAQAAYDNELNNTLIKQIASGRFGVSAEQIMSADEIEIKMAQGAKPGEGGQIPGFKVTIRFAAQRGSLPGVELISPPPHHDLYSIEDLKQLIIGINHVNPKVKIGIKLVATEGIGTIGVGVGKTDGAIINVAGNSGGTGAALVSSIKHAGMTAEFGVAELHRELTKAHLRDRVQIRTSGGFKTPEDVIKAAIMGADLFEFGTTAMMTVGCVMQRSCYSSCEPGVAVNPEKFKGKQLHTERFFAFIAAGVQDRLKELGYSSLRDLRGRTDLLKVLDNEQSKKIDFSPVLDRPSVKPLEYVLEPKKKRIGKDTAMVDEIEAHLKDHGHYENKKSIRLTTTDSVFGGRIAGEFYKKLRETGKQVTLKTTGNSGQQYGFVMCEGMTLRHNGAVQDGAGKSMTGGKLVITTPNASADYLAHKNSIAGNVLLFGASGGQAYVNGVAGERAGVRLSGAELVMEGAGGYALEYMTLGTGMILGDVGKGLCAGASAGIAFVYDETGKVRSQLSQLAADKNDVEIASAEPLNAGETNAIKTEAYQAAMKAMLEAHVKETGSERAKSILANPENMKNFLVLVPKKLNKLNSLPEITNVIATYNQRTVERKASICTGMKVWLEQRAQEVLAASAGARIDELLAFEQALERSRQNGKEMCVSEEVYEKLHKQLESFRASPVNTGLANTPTPPGTPFSMVDSSGDLSKDASSSSLSSMVHVDSSSSIIASGSNPALVAMEDEVKRESPKNTTASPPRIKDIEDIGKDTYKVQSVSNRLSQKEGLLDKIFIPLRNNIAIYTNKLIKEAGGCSGCWAQSCAAPKTDVGCPEEKPINAINSKLKELYRGRENSEDIYLKKGHILSAAQWKVLREAFELQVSKTPFIAYTGAACPAPCHGGCTEGIPDASGPNAKRNGKENGTSVNIQSIEYHLFQLGRFMGWFDGKPQWDATKPTDIQQVFGRSTNGPSSDGTKVYDEYSKMIEGFKAPFRNATKQREEELIIVGSGPAAMQWAFDALRDGFKVKMYEKSEVPGGRLTDGIPHHKFDKTYIAEDFKRLQSMGLQLITGQEVSFDKERGIYMAGGQEIAKANTPKQWVILCPGAGESMELPAAVTANLSEAGKKKIVHAMDILPKFNKAGANLDEASIKNELGDNDPRGKNLLLVGGTGDTAQDVTRWVSKVAKKEVDLTVMARGGEIALEPGIMDSYPNPQKVETPENRLKFEEMTSIGAQSIYLSSPKEITEKDGKLEVRVQHKEYLYANEIKQDPQIAKAYKSLPAEDKPTIDTKETIHTVDQVWCAIGFKGADSIPLVRDTKGIKNVIVSGDAHGVKSKIIVSAQADASELYRQFVQPAEVQRQQPSIRREMGRAG